MSDPSPDEVLYGTVTDELVAVIRGGSRPDLQALSRRYPGVAAELPGHLADIEAILRCGIPSLEAPDRSNSSPSDMPARLGEFRLVREIGRGGMGIVYEAEQESLWRRVALKVLPFAALLEAHRLVRFRHESQAAALLQHPNIVPIYGVGCDRGLHYYAMQLVEGRSLAAHIADLRSQSVWGPTGGGPAAHALGTERARTVAAWMVQAAEALHYAHELGIVHRDVKPANLLLDTRGVLWVTDFGLARLHPDGNLTVTGDVVGSLRYMAPEQALGVKGVVDHRADIYGLGATFYELLTLEPALPGTERDEMYRQLVRDEPRPPRAINRAIPRDVETVILKALSKEPMARYASAQEFADDLRRFLDGRPVLARRPTPVERAHRWVRRNPAVTGAGVVALLVTAAALAVSTVLINTERGKARADRDQAEIQREVARTRRLEAVQAVNKWYSKFGEEWVAEQPQLEDTQREFVLAALAFFEKLAQEPDDDAQFRLERALAYRKAGAIQNMLGEPALGAAAFEQAVALLQTLWGDHPDVPEYRTELATTYTDLARWYITVGRIDAAEELVKQALPLWQQVTDSADACSRDRVGLAQALHIRGIIRHAAGQSVDAKADMYKALAVRSALVTEFPKDARFSEALARSEVDLANVLLETNAPAQESLDLFLGAQKRFDALPTSFRASPVRRHFESLIYQSIGRQLRVNGPLAFAEGPTRRAVEIKSKLDEEFPKISSYRMDLAEALSNHALVLFDLGRHCEAEKQLRKSQECLQSLADASPQHPKYRYYVALDHVNLVAVLRDLNRPDEATKEGDAGIQVLEQLIKDNPRIQAYRKMLAIVNTTRGCLAWHGGRRPEAHVFFTKARDLRIELAHESASTPNEAAGLAWSLATCPDPEIRRTDEIVYWAREGLDRMPEHQQCWLAIGHAYCRDQRTAAEAVQALERSRALANGGDAFHWFGLAIAHRNLGCWFVACACFQRGCQWMNCVCPRSADLLPLRAETAALLSLPGPPSTAPVSPKEP